MSIHKKPRRIKRDQRFGLAALEVVMTTVVTFVIFSFGAYWTIRLSRIVFLVIGSAILPAPMRF